MILKKFSKRERQLGLKIWIFSCVYILNIYKYCIMLLSSRKIKVSRIKNKITLMLNIFNS